MIQQSKSMWSYDPIQMTVSSCGGSFESSIHGCYNRIWLVFFVYHILWIATMFLGSQMNPWLSVIFVFVLFLPTSWGGTPNVMVRRSTFWYDSMHGNTKNIPTTDNIVTTMFIKQGWNGKKCNARVRQGRASESMAPCTVRQCSIHALWMHPLHH